MPREVTREVVSKHVFRSYWPNLITNGNRYAFLLRACAGNSFETGKMKAAPITVQCCTIDFLFSTSCAS
jgi:hypothetical protein